MSATRCTRWGVPLVNENDSVAVDEIRYGDNDSLAAQVALAIGAAGVVLWTDVPGMYTANPRIDASARLIESLSASDLEQFRKCVGGAGTRLGTGGMMTKLDATSLAATGGFWTRIVGCAPLDALSAVIAGHYPSTLVMPTVALHDGRTRWILANLGDGRIIMQCMRYQLDYQQRCELADSGCCRCRRGFCSWRYRTHFQCGDAHYDRDCPLRCSRSRTDIWMSRC